MRFYCSYPSTEIHEGLHTETLGHGRVPAIKRLSRRVLKSQHRMCSEKCIVSTAAALLV